MPSGTTSDDGSRQRELILFVNRVLQPCAEVPGAVSLTYSLQVAIIHHSLEAIAAVKTNTD